VTACFRFLPGEEESNGNPERNRMKHETETRTGNRAGFVLLMKIEFRFNLPNYIGEKP